MKSPLRIEGRDGLARYGEYIHGGIALPFPAALDVEGLFPNLKELRHANVPLFSGEEFVRRYHSRGTHPICVHPLDCDGIVSDSIVLVENWHTASGDPKRYVEWLSRMKGIIPPDTLWYAPAAALPSCVALLIYSGFNLFDFKAVDLASARGLFCMPEGVFPRDDVPADVCSCEGCRGGDLRLHNREALKREIALVAMMARRGSLREYVEMRSRGDAWQVAVMRHLDSAYEFVERYTPIARGVVLRANSTEAINRPEVRRFAERVIGRYIKPPMDTAVLLPCAAKKPYSESRSHRRFRSAIRGRAHELIVTSPLGLVPRELEGVYPAAHYDVPVTGYWDREELHIVSQVIARYLESHPYRRVIAHLEGGAFKAAEMAVETAGISLERSTVGDPQSKESLMNLEALLEGEKPERRDWLVQGIASWQFGARVNPAGMAIRRRVHETEVLKNGRRLFRIDQTSGLLIPTFDGWGLLESGYRIRIDDFVPKGDIFVAGILEADERIREGDEVLVSGELALATGRAMMSAEEMRRSRYGLAVKVRKVLKYG